MSTATAGPAMWSTGDQLTVGGETFVIQAEPERRGADRLVWSLDTRSA